MPGPLPKSKRIQKALGNPGHKSIAKLGDAPAALRGLPECPKRLKGAARDAWEFLVAQLNAMQLDFQADSLALEGACRAYQRAVDADAVIDELGSTFKAGNGYVQQVPACSISERNWKLFRGFCAEFGLTPAARSRLSITPATNAINRFAALGQEWSIDPELDALLSTPRTKRTQ
jgi:P27 family predicted phage terminase small subunit